MSLELFPFTFRNVPALRTLGLKPWCQIGTKVALNLSEALSKITSVAKSLTCLEMLWDFSVKEEKIKHLGGEGLAVPEERKTIHPFSKAETDQWFRQGGKCLDDTLEDTTCKAFPEHSLASSGIFPHGNRGDATHKRSRTLI